MYRLVLYYLIGMLVAAVTFSFFHVLPYDPFLLIFSTLFLVCFSAFVNEICSRLFKAPTNLESTYITALIISLIVSPAKTLTDYLLLACVASLSITSKYIVTRGRKHIFNPVALSVAITSIALLRSANWWVGTPLMVPLVVLGGFFIIRKTRKEIMVTAFLITVIVFTVLYSIIHGNNSFASLEKLFFHSSLFFFAFVMLTEPLTMPTTHFYQLLFAILVGLLFLPQTHLGALYSTPELALLVGNVFAYVVSPKTKLFLTLSQKIQLTPDTYNFIFKTSAPFSFTPGQYMEWTLSHHKPDSRGNRRYFTLASSPTEQNICIGVKFYAPSSSYKKQLLELNELTPIVAAQLAGDFVLPKNTKTKLVFMAGGIGITPFRSMLKYVVDKNEFRDITVFYSNRNPSEIVYTDVLSTAENKLHTKIVYTLTDATQVPEGWSGEVGRITEGMIRTHVPDYSERLFYLSGPHSMVTAFESVLYAMRVQKKQIKTDFFPGFA